MKIILTRHGETLENIEGRLQGHLHGTLSEKGKEQAKLLAKRLENEKIDKIISSDLARAFDTAKEIHQYHPNIDLTKKENLRERNLGELQGKLKSELGINKEKLIAGTIESRNGETQKEMFERANKLVNDLLKDNSQTILLVGHNGINMAIIANLLSKSFKEYSNITPQNNTAVTVFEINNKLPAKIIVNNCTKHLEND